MILKTLSALRFSVTIFSSNAEIYFSDFEVYDENSNQNYMCMVALC